MLLTIYQAAERLAVRWPAMDGWIRTGVCPAPRIVGGFCRFSEAELAAWVAAGCPPCDPPTPREMSAIRRAQLAEDIAERERQERIDALCAEADQE